MHKQNKELTDAINRFSARTDVSAEQVAQFRQAITADNDLVDSFNTAAASGALHDFAIAPETGSGVLVGHYDKSGGVVTLPKASLDVSSPASAQDLKAIFRVQSMVIDFGRKSFKDSAGATQSVSGDMLSNLQDTLNGSPVLAEEVKRAASVADPSDAKHRVLQGFDILPPKSGVGGSYSPSTHTMNLPAPALKSSVPGAPGGDYDAYNLTFVIGHEVQHGFNSGNAAKGRDDFTKAAAALASTRTQVHDYTTLIENYIQTGRDDEASAEISGWNALRSRVEQDVPGATLNDIHRLGKGRTEDFLDIQLPGGVGARSNVALNRDLSMTPSAENVRAMGENYFDRPTAAHKDPTDTRRSMALGTTGDGDYPNYYARWAVESAVLAEQNAPLVNGSKPELTINMRHAKLYEETMERLGMDMGSANPPAPYYDSSQLPSTLHHFDHTSDGPNANTYIPVSPGDGVTKSSVPLNDASHPDYDLFKQARGHVAELDRTLGRTPDVHTDNISAALTIQARADGLSRIDQVALSPDGTKLWVYRRRRVGQITCSIFAPTYLRPTQTRRWTRVQPSGRRLCSNSISTSKHVWPRNNNSMIASKMAFLVRR